MSAIAASAPRHGICGLVVHVLLFGAPAKLPLAMWPVGLYKKKRKKFALLVAHWICLDFGFFWGTTRFCWTPLVLLTCLTPLVMYPCARTRSTGDPGRSFFACARSLLRSWRDLPIRRYCHPRGRESIVSVMQEQERLRETTKSLYLVFSLERAFLWIHRTRTVFRWADLTTWNGWGCGPSSFGMVLVQKLILRYIKSYSIYI